MKQKLEQELLALGLAPENLALISVPDNPDAGKARLTSEYLQSLHLYADGSDNSAPCESSVAETRVERPCDSRKWTERIRDMANIKRVTLTSVVLIGAVYWLGRYTGYWEFK